MSRSDSHWYPRYVGDYGKKTRHLSMVQHGAYTLLMDWYYSNCQPIPLDRVQVHRICTAFAPEEIDAVHAVLQQFFVECEDGWHNERADEEIAKRSEISGKRRVAQAIREEKRKLDECKCTPFAPVLHPVLHPTTTATSTEGEKKDTIVSQEKTPKPPDRRGTRLPPDWNPGQEGLDFATNEGIDNEAAQRMFAEFRDYWTAKAGSGAVKLDWQATWRNWVRNDRGSKRKTGGNAMAGCGERVGPLTAAMRKFADEAKTENDLLKRGGS